MDGTRARARLAIKARSALIAQCGPDKRLTEGGGLQLLADVPWLAAAPPEIVAQQAMLVLAPAVSPRISEKWSRRLGVAVRQIDRSALTPAPGLGIAIAIDLIAALNEPAPERHGGGDRAWQELLPTRPHSLGGIAWALRRLAREWRLHARSRASGRSHV